MATPPRSARRASTPSAPAPCWRRPATPKGFRLVIHCQNNRFVNDEQICQAVAQMLTRTGIRTTVEAMPHVMHVARSRNREFSFWTGLWNV